MNEFLLGGLYYRFESTTPPGFTAGSSATNIAWSLLLNWLSCAKTPLVKQTSTRIGTTRNGGAKRASIKVIMKI
ncbi:MAG: hypothetical protein WBD22_04165 [Pyrinomonadaceae bacterium]